MANSMVFTFIGADKPGLVERLAHTVSQYGGNWMESRMSQLAGQFAGIVQVEVPTLQRQALHDALLDLAGAGLTIVVAVDGGPSRAGDCRQLRLSIIGNDRPGIVREVASALAQHAINVREMDTTITSAPMTAEPLFEALAEIEVPRSLDLAELNQQLDAIADELTVDIALEESLR
jgi:glycine cleavage system regulatory protein